MIKKDIINSSIVDLALVKKQLIIESDFVEDDDLLQLYINSAIEYLENKIHSDIYSKNCTLTIENFRGNKLIIEETPLKSIEEVKVDGQIISGYTFNDDSFLDFRIEFDDYIDDSKIEVKFKTGYTTIPTPLLHCILLLVNDSYENRGTEFYSEKSQMAVLNKINSYIRKYY